MWQRLGLQPEALPLFAKAMFADDRVVSGIVFATLVASRNRPLPKNRPFILQMRYRAMTQLSAALFNIMRPSSMAAKEWCQAGMPVSLDAHSRQQQLLLQAVCWPLPELLLRTALVCGKGEPLLVGVAAAAAAWAMLYWHAPGMEAAATAAKPQQLPAVLDCWLQLMQQQLLQCPLVSASQQQPGDASLQQQQQPLGLLVQVAATSRSVPCNSAAAQQLLGARMCSCDGYAADPPGIFNPDKHGSSNSSGSGSIRSMKLPCDSLQTVSGLLECMSAMKVGGWG
jgi:hypothetical protein